MCIVTLLTSACTENKRAKSFGGSAKIELPQGKKLVNVTWKESNMWVLYRDRRSNEIVDTYTFTEKSTYGILEGKVQLIEK
jgi:hypothetical protein